MQPEAIRVKPLNSSTSASCSMLQVGGDYGLLKEGDPSPRKNGLKSAHCYRAHGVYWPRLFDFTMRAWLPGDNIYQRGSSVSIDKPQQIVRCL